MAIMECMMAHFLQGNKSTELEALINVVWVQGKDFETTVSHLDKMIMKKGYNIESVFIAKTRRHQKCLNLHAYDAVDVMDDDNYATVLEKFMASSLQ